MSALPADGAIDKNPLPVIISYTIIFQNPAKGLSAMESFQLRAYALIMVGLMLTAASPAVADALKCPPAGTEVLRRHEPGIERNIVYRGAAAANPALCSGESSGAAAPRLYGSFRDTEDGRRGAASFAKVYDGPPGTKDQLENQWNGFPFHHIFSLSWLTNGSTSGA